MGCIVTGNVLSLCLLFSFNDIPFSTKKKKMLSSHIAIKDLRSLKDRNQHTLFTVPNINDQTICLSFNVIYFPLLSFTFFFFF